MKKNPIVAAVLNFFLFGGGTFYVGRRRAFAIVLTLGGMVAQIAEIKISPVFDNSSPHVWPFLLGGIVVAKLALAADGYNEAKLASSAV